MTSIDFDPEVAAQWAEAYGAIAGLMQAGARAAEREAALEATG